MVGRCTGYMEHCTLVDLYHIVIIKHFKSPLGSTNEDAAQAEFHSFYLEYTSNLMNACFTGMV